MERKIIGTWNGVELMQGKYYAEVNGKVIGHDRKEDFNRDDCGTIYNIAYVPVGQLSIRPDGLSDGIIAMGDGTPIGGKSKFNYLCNIGSKDDADYVCNNLRGDLKKSVVYATDIFKYLNSKNKTISAV